MVKSPFFLAAKFDMCAGAFGRDCVGLLLLLLLLLLHPPPKGPKCPARS
jgi:hypothetical protein